MITSTDYAWIGHRGKILRYIFSHESKDNLLSSNPNFDAVALNICLFKGSINADIFHAWTTQQLIPSIPPKSVVVMDNAAFHKRTDMLNVFIVQGHDMLFLPSYSPDLNPVENKWAQAKMIRKKHRCNPYQPFETCLL